MHTIRRWHFPWHWLWILLTVLALMLLLPARARNAPNEEAEAPMAQSSLVLVDRVMTREQPNGCERPLPERFFLTGDPYVYLWMRVEGASKGDRPAVAWVRPSGLVHRTDEWDPLPGNGTRCLTARLRIAGDAPANEPGRWLARIEWNGMRLAEHEFAVLDPSRPIITE